jgi:hypothetical protein
MGKRGPKKKPGRHEPNGKPSRKPQHVQERRAADEESAMSVVKSARSRVHGVNADDAGTDLAASVVGRLYLAGKLTPEQMNAARLIADCYASFQRAVDSPAQPKAVAIGASSGPSPRDVEPEQSLRARERWTDIERLLGKVNAIHRGSTIYAACYYVILLDLDLPHLVDDMRLGLSVIAGAYAPRRARAA